MAERRLRLQYMNPPIRSNPGLGIWRLSGGSSDSVPLDLW